MKLYWMTRYFLEDLYHEAQVKWAKIRVVTASKLSRLGL